MAGYEIVPRPERDQLGETPFWDEASQALWWCDIVGKTVYRLDPSSGRHRALVHAAVCQRRGSE